ncbi:tRNA (guanosine(46)-N7)-methyltransferase TrmB [Cyanobium sp. Morenito 9A2]|uniref:tRNA (guanosine(46)-N7)-methyltransferase TrmB n=1 Tax=Cyanobium sp. Morenito 9A2 TaxID=2823718 RepID=UPI0020CE0922|nr:tRNA (guanosine(46)-N7)-methyltransferase TrmB [Cyanobium sp. Morenito 9A2]MCP9849662.1 tRNA (guanosine(46)-N7)-methyltransferase TrmB [Cyanobium sp. Morenito 9A2]
MRQHVNPLSRLYQQPLLLPSPAQLFAAPEQPLHLDVGCARGRFLLAMAQRFPEQNFLGVEIRRGLVGAAEADRLALGLTNLRFLFCNANVNLQDWLGALPSGLLRRISLQFPDPWFKRKHHKRRVLQPALLRAFTAALEGGASAGELFVQSDVLGVIEPMVSLIEASGCFDRPATDSRPWRPDNPLAVATEREQHVHAQGLPVYRVLYRRNTQPLCDLATLEAAREAADNPATPTLALAAVAPSNA